MTFFFIFCLLYIAACVYLLRGGGGYQFIDDNESDKGSYLWRVIYSPMNELKMRGWPSLRDTIFFGVFGTPFYIMPFLIVSGVELRDAAIIAAAHSVGFTLGAVSGWGAYFDMGNSMTNRPQIGWIDSLLKNYFGEMTEKNTFAERFARDYLGFGLRLSYYGAIYVGLGAALWFTGGATDLFLLFITGVALTLAQALIIPLIYGFTGNCRAFQKAVNHRPYKPNSTNYAELLTGAILGGAALCYIGVNLNG